MTPKDDGEADAGRRSGPRSPGISSLLEDMVSPGGPDTSDAGAWRPAPSPGTVIGRFEIVRELGRGGFGIVYEALDRELGRSVAFKLLQGSVKPSAREERLLREAEAAARLSHPNIVTLFDVGRCGTSPCPLVLELLHGETLAQRLSSRPLALRRRREGGGRGGARALPRPCARHRPPRPLLRKRLPLRRRPREAPRPGHGPGLQGGERWTGERPPTSAPEQWRGAPEDERTDVFALGVMLHKMLTGQAPFPDDEGRSARGGRPARALEVPEAPALPGVVARMLAKDPVDPLAGRQRGDGRPDPHPPGSRGLGGFGRPAPSAATACAGVRVQRPASWPPEPSSPAAPGSSVESVPRGGIGAGGRRRAGGGRPALRRPLPGKGSGTFRRRPRRGNPKRAGPNRRPSHRRPDVLVHLPGQRRAARPESARS